MAASPEYRDDFCGDGAKGEKNNLWQQQANKKMLENLARMGLEARQYKNDLQDPKTARLTSYHHAIFINGARGAGKTVFLRNASAAWANYSTKYSQLPDLHFIDVIDPTLLNIDDRFSEVIIASIYASVEGQLNQPEISQTIKEAFFQALRTLAGALGKSQEIDELRGIDRIQKYRSGIHLERDFHRFLIATVNLMGCDALVLPIDDVDMKIDNGFAVLDDIRCLLSCPLILPLVSGDDALYRHITQKAFSNGPNNKFGVGSMAESLSEAYLTKVFPDHIRLPLQPVEQLLPKLEIRYKTSETENTAEISKLTFPQYVNLLKETFYTLCNGQERSTDWTQPVSAREVTQLIRSLPPSLLKGQLHITPDICQKYAHWAERHHDGVALTNMETYLNIQVAQQAEQLNFSQLIAFNPVLQVNRHTWASKEFFSQQYSTIIDMKAHDTNHSILNSVANSSDILRSMPALEFIMEPMFISKSVAEAKNGNPLLLALYTHHDYYSRQLNRRHHIFFSRAFEIIGWSLLAITGNLPDTFYQKDKFTAIFQDIFLRAPFYSIFAMNHTREIEEADDNFNQPDNPVDYSSHINELIEKIYDWCKKRKITELKGKNLIPLLSVIFNKAFSQLAVLRMNLLDKKKAREELLSDLARRFEYIFINSLLTFTKDGLVVNTNVATGARASVVRDYVEFTKYDRTLSRNLSGVIDLTVDDDNSLNLKNINKSEYAELVIAMWCHPIFNIEAPECYPIGDNNAADLFNENYFSKMTFTDIRDFYYKQTGNTTIKTQEVKQWASSNTEIAHNILKCLLSSRVMQSQLKENNQVSWFYRGLAQGIGEEVNS
ncbi:antiviral RADAR system adenosine triphosphatase RdrA [Citrobacter sp. wls613]|uniref:antiviral RADAR system adenosine triphosphatase RdrA n=1 Tax=Citrobacter sp. wls613 TaxID=2576436 RepID=UPI002016B213|nr:antiviral RADAR system adenosine triphosphatase RdrA [Citrobacter sp. wls613]